MKVSTNGWLTFDTSYTSSSSYNYSMPTTSGPENMIAMFWDDLHLEATAPPITTTPVTASSCSSPTWASTLRPPERTTPSRSILFPNGKILLQYLEMTGTDLEAATIGVEDGTGNIGLEMVYNDPYVHDELAVQISRTPDWLRRHPEPRGHPAGGFFDFAVDFDATDRIGGDWTAPWSW